METKLKEKTHKEYLTELAESDTCSEDQEKIILYWAYQLGFNNAVVTCGIIYPEGIGHAFSCNQFAKSVLKQLEMI